MDEIVILGAGYAGLRALKELQRKKGDFHITLVDQNDYHYEATDLHEVASGNQPSDKIIYDIADVVQESRTQFLQATVTRVDLAQQVVLLANDQQLSYDYLVMALGFESETFGIPGVDEYALSMTNVTAAETIYDHIREQMTHYQHTEDPRALRIIVCGAGFTGIELLGALADARKEYAQLAGVTEQQIQITCLEASTRLLPMFDDQLAGYGISKVHQLGIDLKSGMRVKEIQPGKVQYADEAGTVDELEANTIIWTTGVRGSRVIEASGLPQKRGRVMVEADLTAPGAKNVYIVGDVAAVMNPANQRPYPTTAQISLKMGSHAAKNILRQVAGQATEPFTFKSLGSVASVGNTRAFGLVGSVPVKGYPASFVKKAIMDRSLLETGGVKELMAKGRFDFYH